MIVFKKESLMIVSMLARLSMIATVRQSNGTILFLAEIKVNVMHFFLDYA